MNQVFWGFLHGYVVNFDFTQGSSEIPKWQTPKDLLPNQAWLCPHLGRLLHGTSCLTSCICCATINSRSKGLGGTNTKGERWHVDVEPAWVAPLPVVLLVSHLCQLAVLRRNWCARRIRLSNHYLQWAPHMRYSPACSRCNWVPIKASYASTFLPTASQLGVEPH